MSKIKNNGFVMMETIIVVVFVLGLVTFLFANVFPLLGDYERLSNYDSITAEYDVHQIRKMLLKDNSCKVENILTLTELKPFNSFRGDEICYYLENKNYCQKLLSKDFLDVKEIIITKFYTQSIKDNHGSAFSREIVDYINYMPKYTSVAQETINNYFFQRRLIVVFNNGKMANLEYLKTNDPYCNGTVC